MPQFPTLFVNCLSCRGRGAVSDGEGVSRCPRCGGSGFAPKRVKRVAFDYVFPSVVLNNTGGVVTQPLQLDDDSLFEQVGWMLRLSPGAGGTFSSIQIIDQSNGWQFSNNPIQIPNFACGGFVNGTPDGLMFPLLVPYLWVPTAQAQIKVTDVTAGNVLLQVVMKGYKLFEPDGSPIDIGRFQEQMAA